MASLGNVICNIYQSTHASYYSCRGRSDRPVIPGRKYMEIPICTDTFEMPVIGLKKFLCMPPSNLNNYKSIAVLLQSSGHTSDFKSAEAIIKNTMDQVYTGDLYQILIEDRVYYISYGVVFNANLVPIVMLSWLLEKEHDTGKFKPKRPLLRVDPGLYVTREDAFQRFLCGKLITTALSEPIPTPGIGNVIFNNRFRYFDLKVEIDKCPFNIKTPDTPSISVTEDRLKQLAVSHIDELLQ